MSAACAAGAPVQVLGPRTVERAVDQPADRPAPPPTPVLTFREGLLGFPECRQFLLSATERAGFYWLQSVEHAPLAFLLVDPFVYFPGYSVELGDADVTELEASAASEIAILCTVTLPRTPSDTATSNLQGPIVLNLRTGKGRQVVIPDSPWGLRAPLDLGPSADAA